MVKPVRLALSALAAMVLISGCRFEVTLDESGGGTLRASFHASQYDTLPKLKSRFMSDSVEVTKASMDAKYNVDIEVKFKDFTKLNSVLFFNNVTFALTEDAAAKTKTASATTKYLEPAKLTEAQLDEFGRTVDLAITVPGEIVKTDATKTDDKTARWSLPTATLLGQTSTTFSATFKASTAATSGASAGTPAGTPKTK